jgi:hypothetical protein
VLMLNLLQELYPIYEQRKEAPRPLEEPAGCTDVHVIADGRVSAWGHSEDMSVKSSGYLVHATLISERGDELIWRYTSYAYAGCLAGWAWGFNDAGHVQSINALTPRGIKVGRSASFVARDTLTARSLDDAIRRACAPAQGGGQRFNLGNTAEVTRRVFVECSPGGCEVKTIRSSAGGESSSTASLAYHCNIYAFGGEASRIEGLAEQRRFSSTHRMRRLAELHAACEKEEGEGTLSPPAWASVDWIKTTLTDETGQYPIFRTATPPDKGVSDHLIIVSLLDRTLRVFRGPDGQSLRGSADAGIVHSFHLPGPTGAP